MDWVAYAVAGRVVERLVVVFFSGLSVYLGYRLFLKIPEVRDAQGEVKLPSMNMTVKVSRIGPGIFFAIFGAAVLLASYLHPVSIEPPSKAQSAAGDTSAGGKFVGASPTQSEQDQILRRRVVAQAMRSLGGVQTTLAKQASKSEKAPILAVRDAKLLLMDFVWDPGWGDPAALKEAVASGRARDDKSLSPQTRDALAFYDQTEAER
jgi:hypothetical protein